MLILVRELSSISLLRFPGRSIVALEMNNILGQKQTVSLGSGFEFEDEETAGSPVPRSS